jgi:RNA polymerase sigma factor (sigma-70 family)
MTGYPVAALPVVATLDASGERLAALFEAHEDRLYRLARRLTASAGDAEDLVQETFLKAATSMRSVPIGPQKEEAWLVRVLINVRRDQWRKTAVRKRAAPMLRAGAATSHSNQESALIDKRAVWGALDALHPRRRAVVIMHELEGMSPSAIGSLLALSGLRADAERIVAGILGR